MPETEITISEKDNQSFIKLKTAYQFDNRTIEMKTRFFNYCR